MVKILSRTVIVLVVVGMAVSCAFPADKLPAAKAGEIGQPTGKIAFARDKNVWVMNADGNGQMLVTEVMNTDGRMSWAPDNRRIMFTRSGSVDLKGPDMLGGRHKVYDLFVAFLDSADANNTRFWYRITDDLGNRDAQWLKNDRVIFWKDMNANLVNASMPNYQVAIMDDDGSNIDLLRKDWQNMSSFLTAPSLSPDSQLAFVYFSGTSQLGLVVIPLDKAMMPTDSIKALAEKNRGLTGPAWSPDGKWLAYVSSSMNSPGLFIATPDLSERYLVFEPPVGTFVYPTAPSFSPNSKWLTFATSDGSVWTCDITGSNARRLTGPGTDQFPAWSK